MREGALPRCSSLSVSLALRYLRSGGKRYSSFVAWVSIAGLCLGVGALVAVMSVMNGLGAEIEARVLGNVTQVLLTPQLEAISSQQFDQRVTEMEAHEEVLAAFEFVEVGGVVSLGSGVHPILVYAVGDEARPWLPISRPYNDWRGLVIGESLAEYFAVNPGDSLKIVLVGAEGKTRAMRKQVRGLFQTNSDLDYSLVFLPLHEFFELSRIGIGSIGVRLVVEDPLATPELIEGWRSQGLLNGIEVEDWTIAHGELVRVLGMERVIMFSLLLMIVVIAALNLVSGQAMLVSEKQSEIAILQTFGASGGLIARTFLAYGGFVALLGTGLGLVLGVSLATWSGEIIGLIRVLFGIDILAGSWFQSLPHEVRISDLLVVGVSSLLMSLLACVLPARRAAHLSAAEELA